MNLSCHPKSFFIHRTCIKLNAIESMRREICRSGIKKKQKASLNVPMLVTFSFFLWEIFKTYIHSFKGENINKLES